MLYQVLKYFFDWDYIFWRNTADCGVARVHKSPEGTCFYFRYKSTSVVDRIHSVDQVTWLTCCPYKAGYFKDPEAQQDESQTPDHNLEEGT